MNTKIKKTTTTRTTVQWTETVTDDNDVIAATMMAAFNQAQPLGNFELTVNDRGAYENLKDEIKEAYASFQSEFASAVENLEAVTKEVTDD